MCNKAVATDTLMCVGGIRSCVSGAINFGDGLIFFTCCVLRWERVMFALKSLG